MFSQSILSDLKANLGQSLVAFAPELLLCVGVVVLLLVRLLPRSRGHLGGVALVVTALGLAFALVPVLGVQKWLFGESSGSFFMASRDKPFGGMLALDHMTNYVRLILFGF